MRRKRYRLVRQVAKQCNGRKAQHVITLFAILLVRPRRSQEMRFERQFQAKGFRFSSWWAIGSHRQLQNEEWLLGDWGLRLSWVCPSLGLSFPIVQQEGSSDSDF